MDTVYDAKLLIVDDNAELLALLCEQLRGAGYGHIRTAQSCTAARACFAAEQPELMILDINLPDGDGFSLFRALRAKADVPALFLSARDADADRLFGLGLGADDYLTKPFLMQELLLRVQHILQRAYRAELSRTKPAPLQLGERCVDLNDAIVTLPEGKTLLANAAEELCFHYARTSKLQVKVFRLPYLYAVSASGADQFARLFEQMPAGTVQMEEQAAQPLLALCAEELADLVARVFDTWTPEPERFTLPDVFGSTQGQLGEVLQKLQPGLKVLYGTDTIQTYPAADNAVRRRYGWFQRYSILDDLPAIYHAWCARKTEKKSFIRKMVDKIRRSPLLLRLAEIAAAWLATELLVRITGTDAQFRMIDLRLMFVVLIGTVYGLNAGVLSAVLASVSLAAGYLRQGTTLMLLFYAPANWLAFIVYFVVGASCGYVQLRNTETARFVQEENELLRKRLEFTRKLYQDTLEDKRLFRRQILGRRDSFGKIYAVTQQLDMLQPQEICRKTVQIMEDVLENHSLTIYRMEKNQGFARLTAASAGMTPEPAYSLEVDQWLDVLRAIEQEGLWVNRGFLPGRPMYAAGVRQNGSLVVLIGLHTASEEQMTLYYQNLFRILCGLVETALVRAFEYESVVRENWYLPGTCLLRPDVFAEQLATACTLQEDKMAHHLLLQVTGKFKNRAEINDRVRRSIRSTDAAGVGTNNAIYLLMNQTDEENLPLLTRRLGEKGLHVTAVPLDEQLRLISAAKQEASHA